MNNNYSSPNIKDFDEIDNSEDKKYEANTINIQNI